MNEEKTNSGQDLEDNSGFNILKRLIKENTNFNCEQYKEAHFKRRLNVRLRATGSECYADYLKKLKENPGEYENLKKTLTINVSEFFRNPETFEIIEKEILPRLIESKSDLSVKSIRIWSAGCAAGEEAYSLAILLHEILGKDFKNYRISILGTDIDDSTLEKAKKGTYNEDALKNVNQYIKELYFIKKGERYQIIDQLKDVTYFKHHDMISGPCMNRFDLVICRNVIIYFKRDIQEQLQLSFYRSLNKGGFLIIGKAETILGIASSYFKPYNARERIYVKNN